MILYIHIPFCTSKCGYCTFNSYEKQDALKEIYVEALCKDLKNSLEANTEMIDSIFFGGGTPNTLDIKSYEKIFTTIQSYAKLDKDCEITTEANPDLISLKWCAGMREFGVNRLSMGIQSFFKDKLVFLQREHNEEKIFDSMYLVYQSGIQNISIDLIYDTPQDNKKRIFEEIHNASKMPINHLSAYSLTIEKNSKLEKIYPQNPQNKSFHQEVFDALKHYGFHQYEVSNYARDYKVRHNLAYWNSEEYIGCGAGAVGRIGSNRIYSQANIHSYIQSPLEKKIEILSKDELIMESIFLGLRCEIGVNKDRIDEKKLKILLEENKCHLKGNKLVANDYSLADEIALWLL